MLATSEHPWYYEYCREHPEVLARLVREIYLDKGVTIAGASFPAPAALVVGDGKLTPHFGRRLRGTARTAVDAVGRLVHFTVESGRAQLDLFHDDLATLRGADDTAILQAIGRVLDNGTWRTFMGCFAAADDDLRRHRVPGPGYFFYTPTRFGDVLGPRERDGATLRQPKRRYSLVDRHLANLGSAKLTATMKVGGRTRQLCGERLVYYAHASLEEIDGDGPAPKPGEHRGRRAALLYTINPALMMLMDPRKGGWYMPLPAAALRPPAGVDPRTWDDAFKLLTVMVGHARQNYGDARDDRQLPWRRRIAGLVTEGNVAGHGISERHARARVRDLVVLLQDSGFVRAHDIEGDGADQVVMYDLPPEQRRQLASIRDRRRTKKLLRKSNNGVVCDR